MTERTLKGAWPLAPERIIMIQDFPVLTRGIGEVLVEYHEITQLEELEGVSGLHSNLGYLTTLAVSSNDALLPGRMKYFLTNYTPFTIQATWGRNPALPQVNWDAVIVVGLVEHIKAFREFRLYWAAVKAEDEVLPSVTQLLELMDPVLRFRRRHFN